MSTNIDSLVRGNVRMIHFNCPYDDCGGCITNPTKLFHINSTMPWLLTFKCLVCNRGWNVCRTCHQTKCMISNLQINRHKNLIHKKVRVQNRFPNKKRSLVVDTAIESDVWNQWEQQFWKKNLISYYKKQRCFIVDFCGSRWWSWLFYETGIHESFLL
jgi:hypothetical protein